MACYWTCYATTNRQLTVVKTSLWDCHLIGMRGADVEEGQKYGCRLWHTTSLYKFFKPFHTTN